MLYRTAVSVCVLSLLCALASGQAAAAADNASFVSQVALTSLKPGQSALVSVTMKNTGTTTWTEAAGYRLGSQNPQDNHFWGTGRVLLGAGESIAPGQQKTFSFTITAPLVTGSYNFQWRMLREGVAWFGAFSTNVLVNVTTANVNNSAFVSQSVPSALGTGQTVSVSVTMRNMGNTVWVRNGSLGWKLGSWNPQDNTTWGTNRVMLATGDSIGPGQQKTFTFNITAPLTPGSYNFQWRMLEETVEWFGALSTNQVIQVTQVATVCAGVTTPLDGVTDNAPALRQCIQNTPTGGTLQIPAGVYTLRTAVPITKSMTLRTAGTSGSTQNCEQPGVQCATLRAASNFSGTTGMLTVDNLSAVHIDHLIVDGNRGARLGSFNASQCASGAPGTNRYGYNVRLGDCAGCSFRHNVSKNTLCGTALEFRGNDGVIVNNVIRSNGQNSATNMWADGITIHFSDRATVTDNLLVDNSDVGLILGGGRNAFVARNTIQQATQVAFAGLMLDNFNGGTHGDFTGTTVTQNTVSCGTQRWCHFGINLGPHPWYQPPSNILGGTVTGNTVTNARQGINVDGAGTVAAPLVLYNNSASGSPTSATFLCGTMATSNLNIYTAHSVVDRQGDTTPATNRIWHNCP